MKLWTVIAAAAAGCLLALSPLFAEQRGAFAEPVATAAATDVVDAADDAEAPAADAAGAAAQDDSDAPAEFVEITPELRAAVGKGLAYLARAQAPDGSYGHDRYGKHVGITALACLAFMSDGHLPGRGIYGPNVEKGLDFVLRHVEETGLIAADTSHGPMYGHGFATLFLGEIYGMTGDERLREALVKAVRLIEATQNDQGGWRYHAVPFDADISVTICQVMALRSARNAGISVAEATIERAIGYVRNCQNRADGGFRYMLNNGQSGFERSAAGVASLYYAGVYEDRAIERGLDYLLENRDKIRRGGGHYYYGQYYAVQAMFLAGGRYWQMWFPDVRQHLIASQQADGHWPSPNHGDQYATAMALITLQVPNRFLPIFQR